MQYRISKTKIAKHILLSNKHCHKTLILQNLLDFGIHIKENLSYEFASVEFHHYFLIMSLLSFLCMMNTLFLIG